MPSMGSVPPLATSRTSMRTPGRCSSTSSLVLASAFSGGSAPLARLVVAGRILQDDVHSIIGIDERDERDEGGELVVVVVLARLGPDLIADAAAIGDPGAVLGERE